MQLNGQALPRKSCCYDSVFAILRSLFRTRKHLVRDSEVRTSNKPLRIKAKGREIKYSLRPCQPDSPATCWTVMLTCWPSSAICWPWMVIWPSSAKEDGIWMVAWLVPPVDVAMARACSIISTSQFSFWCSCTQHAHVWSSHRPTRMSNLQTLTTTFGHCKSLP